MGKGCCGEVAPRVHESYKLNLLTTDDGGVTNHTLVDSEITGGSFINETDMDSSIRFNKNNLFIL